jgi:hypothetical protein
MEGRKENIGLELPTLALTSQSLLSSKATGQWTTNDPAWRRVCNTSIVALRVVEGNERGTQCLGVYRGHPVTGGRKYTDLVLQVAGWTQGWLHCSVKRNIVAKSKEVKTGCKLAESSKEACGSEGAVLPTMVMNNNKCFDTSYWTFCSSERNW